MAEEAQIIQVPALPISRISFPKITIEQTDTRAGRNQASKPILHNGNPLIFQTPFLTVMEKPAATTHRNIVEMMTSFEAENPSDKKRAARLFDFFEGVEDHLTSLVVRDHTKCFTTKEIELKPIIRANADGQYYIRWLVDMTEATVTDQSQSILDLIDLEPGSLVKMIVELAYVWFGNEMFGLGYKVHRILTKKNEPPVPVVKTEYLYVSDDEESSEEEDPIRSMIATERPRRSSPIKTRTTIEPPEEKSPSTVQNIFEGSDDDLFSD